MSGRGAQVRQALKEAVGSEKWADRSLHRPPWAQPPARSRGKIPGAGTPDPPMLTGSAGQGQVNLASLPSPPTHGD